jgi:hypothetical protein
MSGKPGKMEARPRKEAVAQRMKKWKNRENDPTGWNISSRIAPWSDLGTR